MNNEYENPQQSLEEDWTVGEPHFHSKQPADVLNDGEVQPGDAVNSQAPKSNDDWAMNTIVGGANNSSSFNRTDSANRAANTPDTNPLMDEKNDKWQMPEPIFRVSGGKKIEKSASPMPRLNSPAKFPEPAQMASPTTDIQPQPYISEEFTVADVAVIEEPPAKVRSKTARIIFIVAGISAMILFAVGFLIGVYFLFIKQAE